MSAALTPVEVFCSYAHEDEPWLRKLETHLSLLKRQGLIDTWHDRHLLAGANWAHDIDAHLERASVILLLISADFLSSDYCTGVEMQRALERQEAGEARVIPILVRSVDWKAAPFAQLQVLPTDAKPVSAWRDKDAALADVASGIRRVIEELPLLAASAARSALPAHWMMPYPRNPFFLGRDELLGRLHEQLQAGQTMALSQPQAISGLGGIGKTQLAIEYVYRYHQEYEAVLWARAENQEALMSSYSTIAGLLRLPEGDAPQQERTVQAVRTWLQTHRGWLLILDNADELDLLPTFLPPTPGGHILLTTRAWDMQRLAGRLEVESFSPEQGAEFLLRRAGLLTPETVLDQVAPAERALALQLVGEMGGLPLALDQAGAYLEATGMTLEQYQQVYQQHRQALLAERRARVLDHPDPVATTWSLSFQRVEQQQPAAADLLRLCAFLAPDAIAEEILTAGASVLGPVLAAVAADPFLLGQAIEALRAYSLVGRDPRTMTLSIHRLVQAVLQDQMDEDNQREWAERAMCAVHAVLPTVEHGTWSAWERVVVHVQVCAQQLERYGIQLAEAAELLQQTGWYLTDRARYPEAEPLLEQAYAMSIRAQGPEHLDTALDALTLAYLYKAQGKYEQAEPLYQRALTIYEQQLGADHPLTAESLNNLAGLYRVQGKYEQAEPLYQRVLAIREQRLGETHPLTTQSLNNLAGLYRAQGKYEQALPLYQRALAINTRAFGPEHTDIKTIKGDYARFLEEKKRKRS